MTSGSLWSLATIAGPIILGLAIAYALIRQRRLTRVEREAQARGTERLYSKSVNDD